jgi:hypothetical protein
MLFGPRETKNGATNTKYISFFKKLHLLTFSSTRCLKDLASTAFHLCA